MSLYKRIPFSKLDEMLFDKMSRNEKLIFGTLEQKIELIQSEEKELN